MKQEAIKLELIEWLIKLKDANTISYLKVVKDSESNEKDWWNDLSKEQKFGIERGLRDIDSGKVVSHTKVKMKYGL